MSSIVPVSLFTEAFSLEVLAATVVMLALIFTVCVRHRPKITAIAGIKTLPPSSPPPLDSSPPHRSPSALLASRDFVCNMARLAEHIMMNDVPMDFWDFDEAEPLAAEELRLRLRCREQAPFFAPDKVGDVPEKPPAEAASCHVRWQRARWTVAFKQQFKPTVADWIDTGVGLEKPACVLLLEPLQGGPPLIAVAFRGSKTFQDYARTDVSPSFIPVPCGDLADELGLPAVGGDGAEGGEEAGEGAEGTEGAEPSDEPDASLLAHGSSSSGGSGGGGGGGSDGMLGGGDDGGTALAHGSSASRAPLARLRSVKSDPDLKSAKLMVFLSASKRPCVTLGAWKAYAGEEEAASFDGYNPRARVRRAVERLLRSYPKARLVLTGHSLGGVLSTLCAFDLIAQSEVVRSAGPLTLINFAAPRMFNQAFQDAMSTLEESGRLHALRVVVGADMIARIPPKQLGCVHGVLPRILLHPKAAAEGGAAAACQFSAADPDDADLWRIQAEDAHIFHALYLGGEVTPGHRPNDPAVTVPVSTPWPITTT